MWRLLYVPICSAPCVTRTDSGFQSVNALTGAADQCLQIAVAIAHGGGLAGDRQLHGTTEAAAVVGSGLGRRCGLAVE
jgi:hypothetical protein